MMRYIICLLFLILTIRSHGQDCDCVYPIIFVHGFIGNEKSWLNFSKELTSIWGDEIIIPDMTSSRPKGTVYYANLNSKFGSNNTQYQDDVILHEGFSNAPEILNNKCIYAISFDTKLVEEEGKYTLFMNEDDEYDNIAIPQNESNSNASSTYKQGYALGKMIDTILSITKKEKVILVGHSMGGLAAREYLQRRINPDPSSAPKWWVYPSEPDGHRVAKLFTVGTPHRGSNIGAAIDNLLPFFKRASEAVRDLKYTYSPLTPVSAPYLYSGSEDNCFFNDPDPHNNDIDCNGNQSDMNIFGINESGNPAWEGTIASSFYPLPTSKIKYTYYVGNSTHFAGCNPPSIFGCGGDGVVSDKRQWLYMGGDGSTSNYHSGISKPYPLEIENYFQSDRITSPKSVFHFKVNRETDDFDNLIRGIDEADYPYFAGKIEPFKIYAGLVQQRADLVPESSSLSNNEFTGVDFSTTPDNLKDGDWYKIEIDEPSDDLHLILIKQPDLLSRIDFFHNSTPDPYSNPPAENNFYQQSGIGEDPIIDLPLGNLAIDTYYFRITHILSENENEAWKKPYKFMIGTSSQCRANLRYQSEDKTISTLGSEQEGVYYLIDTDRNIVTYDYAQSSDPGLARIDFDYDCYWENTTSLSVTTDVHWGLEMAHDFLNNELNHTFDAWIRAYVNYNLTDDMLSNNSNAIALGDKNILKFGYGDAVHKRTLPVASLDVVGHEFFHLVLDQLGKLNYFGEPGALNEGFADIFGTVLEYYKDPDNFDWLIGEDFHLDKGKAWRSMQNPLKFEDANTYQATNWVESLECVVLDNLNTKFDFVDETDNCGVHTNSGILNKWFYLLSEGGKGLNGNNDFYAVDGIGIEKAYRIAFNALFNFLEKFSDFEDMRDASLISSLGLFQSECSFEYNAVKNAWYAVGLGEPGIMVEKLEISPVTCQLEDGEATVLMIEGNTNYSFQWDNGQTGITCTNLSKGDHEVTITQSTGEECELIYPFIVTEELSFTSTIKTNPNTNCDLPNGKATLSIKDQTTNSTPANLQIIWLDSENNDIGFQTTQLNDLSAGQYSVVIQDTETGCTENLPFTIENKLFDIQIEGGGYRPFCQGKLPPHIKLYPFVKDCPSCEVVDWDTTDGIILEEASDLSEITVAVQNATYSLTMKDENGCSETVFTSIQVDERDCTECADDNLEFISFTGVDPCKGFIVNVLQPIDPNEIIGPEGYGDPNWISINDEVPYTVLFENDPEFAMADARRVEIIHYFDDKANPATFRLSDFGFANLSFTVPTNRSFYQARLDARDSLGVYVDVVAGIDVVNNKAFWILEAIDPSTGQPPLDPDVGMLPINDSLTHKGEGYVNFSLHSIATAITGDTLLGQATILFDENEPIETNIHYNVIDAVAPTSQIDSLPDLIDTTAFTISWIGADDPGGSGLKVYNLYVAENAGPYLLYQSNLVDTSLVFKGRKGDTYSFYTRAIDNTGNIEKPKPGVSVTIKDDLLLAAKVILQGPYDGGEQLMRDDLRVQGKIPLLEPYLDFGFVTATGQEKIDTSILLNIGPNAIIDWIFVELRNAKDYSIVEATRSALLQRDGDIVDLDGISPVVFFNLKPDEYFVVIRHRNHLGIRSSQPVSLSSIATSYDFTAVLSQAAGTTPLHDLGNGKFGLYAGNANFDAQINAVDKNTFWRVQNGQPYVYGISIADFNMDGTVNAVDKNSYWRINNSIVEQIE